MAPVRVTVPRSAAQNDRRTFTLHLPRLNQQCEDRTHRRLLTGMHWLTLIQLEALTYARTSNSEVLSRLHEIVFDIIEKVPKPNDKKNPLRIPKLLIVSLLLLIYYSASRLVVELKLFIQFQFCIRKNVAEYCGNVELCKLTEQVLFFDPYKVAQYNRWTFPYLDRDAEVVLEDNLLKLEVAELKSKFCERAHALIHGDLHTGSVMVFTVDYSGNNELFLV
ncbi:hypothetical protein PIB30_055203 [Stylosanthes scabra]|uniref:S-methyl-5-thioribose kinase n=1 Tax=Stylosanthes scabra TaxID=79078 RepID=A0ABU6QII0_9FABA|nr:hypothetical protein [Stylosanthes scabra]